MIALKDADISLVVIVEYPLVSGRLYPACVLHGAMNKLTSDGIWRCVATYRRLPDGRLQENACRAGFQEGESS